MFSMFGAEGLVSVLGLVRNGAGKGRGQVMESHVSCLKEFGNYGKAMRSS